MLVVGDPGRPATVTRPRRHAPGSGRGGSRPRRAAMVREDLDSCGNLRSTG